MIERIITGMALDMIQVKEEATDLIMNSISVLVEETIMIEVTIKSMIKYKVEITMILIIITITQIAARRTGPMGAILMRKKVTKSIIIISKEGTKVMRIIISILNHTPKENIEKTLETNMELPKDMTTDKLIIIQE